MALIQLPQKEIVRVRDALLQHVDKAIVDDAVSLLDLDPEDLTKTDRKGRLGEALQFFNKRGRIIGFLNTIVERNPAARVTADAAIAFAIPQLDRLAQSLRTSTIGVIGRGHQTLSFGEGKDGWLQRLVKKEPQSVDHAALLLRMIAVGQRVCRIERDGGSGAAPALGTGFLVQKDLVLTNWHVAKPVKCGQVPAAALRCRFDFMRDATGTIVAPGVATELSASGNWLVDESQFAPGDDKPGEREATADELDYALLELAKPVGEDVATVPGTDIERRRGWYDLDKLAAGAPVKGDELIVVGHAEGAPLTHSMGETLGYAAKDRRLRHDAFTLGGSSGSPVFNSEYQLVALHHAGDPDPGKKAEFNQAIPIGLIAARSAAKRTR